MKLETVKIVPSASQNTIRDRVLDTRKFSVDKAELFL